MYIVPPKFFLQHYIKQNFVFLLIFQVVLFVMKHHRGNIVSRVAGTYFRSYFFLLCMQASFSRKIYPVFTAMGLSFLFYCFLLKIHLNYLHLNQQDMYQ